MRKNFNKNIFLLFLFLALVNAGQNQAHAVYDIIKAKDIENENEIKTQNEEQEIDFELPYYDTQKDLGSLFSSKIKKIFKRKKHTQDIETSQEEKDNQITKNTYSTSSSETIEDKNKFQVNANKIIYNDEDGTIEALGNVKIIAKAQDVTLKANKAILDKSSQTLKLFENVKVIKKNVEMQGEYLLVDLNEQNILMDNPTINAYSFAITAQEGYLIANDIQMLNGTIKSTKQSEFPLVTHGFMRYDNINKEYTFGNNTLNTDLSTDAKKQSYKIDAKEIIVTSYKDHNSIMLKGSNVFFNNHKIVRNSDIEIISDKQKQIIETSAPEAGNLRNFGTYIGYGMAFKMPKGHTFKLMPVLAYKDSDIGIGAIGRYRSPNHMVEGGWNTASENWVVRGKYRIADGLNFTYGRHAYLPEGFLGARRSGYAGQLDCSKSYYIRDLKAHFSNGVYAGVFSDYDKDDQEDAYSTTRFRYMAQLRKNIFEHRSKDKDFYFQSGLLGQAAATVYGSGETTGITRFGPSTFLKYKKWEQAITYLVSGTHGHSPFLFDEYMYGKSTIMLNEKFHFNDKLAMGMRLFVTPMKDNYKEDLFTESRVYFIIGPRDAKVALSYDFVRDVSHLDFLFLIGSDNAKINFEKLSTKDIDGKQERADFYKSSKKINIQRPKNL